MSATFDVGEQVVRLIPIPEASSGRESAEGFSLRKLWAFTGPGFLLCIAYMDPGNIENDLQSGVKAKYKIIWILLVSTAVALLMQRLSLRLGVVTGKHLAEMCHLQYPALPRIFLWLMMEVAIIGSDMQEVIGTAIALYLLSNKLIPLWLGVVLTVIDTFMFLLLDRYGLRKLEIFFGILVTVMVVTFGYELFVAKPNGLEMLKGMVYPWCEGCDRSVALQAIGIVGATITPHNLYLHSGMVKSRAIDRSKLSKVKEANFYFSLECLLGLSVSLTINIIVVSVFAHGLHNKTNADVAEICERSGVTYDDVFMNNTDIVELDIYKSGVFLGCQYGVAALYVWGLGVLAAGEGATMMGCYAGQLTMEGFLQLEWVRWKRVLLTRSIAILPTFAVAFYSSLPELSGLNDILNAMFSVQIPFAVLPLVAFTSNAALMGQFANGAPTKLLMAILSVSVIAINVFFVSTSVLSSSLFRDPWFLVPLLIYAVIYLGACCYLILHMAASMTAPALPTFANTILHKNDWRNKNLNFWKN